MTAITRLPIARLTRSPRAWLPIVAFGGLSVVAALFERARQLPHGADLVLLGPFGGMAVPLLSFAVVAATTSGDGLYSAGRSLVALGASPRRAALATLVVSAVASALLAAILGASLVLLAGGEGPLGADALTSAWVAALGGVAYASLFTLGASIGARGGARAVLLVADWLLGAGSGAGALLTPRAHLRNLLGGAPPLDWSQTKSAIALLVLTVAFAALALRRAR